jgi:hypothetical protein
VEGRACNIFVYGLIKAAPGSEFHCVEEILPKASHKPVSFVVYLSRANLLLHHKNTSAYTNSKVLLGSFVAYQN